MSRERELLEKAKKWIIKVGCSSDYACDLCDEIDTELSKPDPDPVGVICVFMYENNKCFNTEWFKYPGDLDIGNYQLYTSPPARKPLSDAGIDQEYFNSQDQHLRPQDRNRVVQFARAIEKAHGIGDL